jgi:phosphatidylserine/phosphatidylglycerophosphate/cardiolipin synthase-like enzyme
MRKLLSVILSSILVLSACGGSHTAVNLPRLVVEPDDGRAPMLEAIASATDNIRLTIYALTDLQLVVQTPAAPAASIAQALIDKAKSGVAVRVIVDHNQYGGTGANAPLVQQTVAALRNAGATVYVSNTNFCFTHQKTFVIDGPTSAKPALVGTAIIMSLNLTPGYFGGTRDYAVITNNAGVVGEISRVFDSDFALANPTAPANPAGACLYAHYPWQTKPPPSASDTPSVSEADLLWSPVNSKPKLLQLMASVKQSLVLTTEELTDSEMVCQIQAVAQSAAKPSVRILLSGDTGSNASAVKTLLDLGLPNLSIRVMPGQPTLSSSVPTPTPLYMHGKQVIADGAQAFIGSENLTNTSLIQNRELGTLFTNPVMVARLQAVFDSDFTTPGSSVPAKACTTGTQGCATIHCPAQP